MPERVKIVFDEDGVKKQLDPKPSGDILEDKQREDATNTTTTTTKKRKAEQAFLGQQVPRPHDQRRATKDKEPDQHALGVAERHRLRQKQQQKQGTEGKVVNFHDRNHESIKASVDPGSAKNANLGRLKKRAADLLQVREKLPIWAHKEELVDKVRNHDVLLLVGETGSGKSTQVPQFVLNLCRRHMVKDKGNVGGTVAITQPRRVAAISLARRVAEEMGTPLGNSSPASQVGYSVRFDNSVSPSTRVKFLTDGMLLQELLRDPWLKEYSIVVVDEVHERGSNVDLVLGFLKRLIEGRNSKDGRSGHPLKVVVMSATADMEKIQDFFGRNAITLDDTDRAIEMERIEDAKETSSSIDGTKSIVTPNTTSCYIKGRQYPVKMHYTPVPISNTLDTALERIIDIHTHSPLPGDVLVFLPGQETIESLESMCNSYAQSLQAKSKAKGAPRVPKLLILPLFAALPNALQQRVFEQTPPFTRKIIISTNIAETSVTVPGIRHVIDTGKRKARFFRPQLNLDTLLTKPISRSSANQRSGRAGREAAGNCYRLYTEKTFYELAADTEPEILRCDLSQLVLTLKAHNIENVLAFPLLTPPPPKALERALLHLLRLRALNRKTGQITNLGRQMSTLPLPANLARVLLASQLPEHDCMEEIIDIVSGLSVENVWLPIHNQNVAHRTGDPLSTKRSKSDNDHRLGANNPEDANKLYEKHGDKVNDDKQDDFNDDESQDPIAQARSTLFRREGDHLTLLAAVQAYTKENADRKEWCRRHGISHRAMTGAMDVRKQLRKLMLEGKRYKLKGDGDDGITNGQSGSKRKPDQRPLSTNQALTDQIHDYDLPTRILKTLLLGLSDNIARLSPAVSTTTSKESIWIGPYQTLSTNRNLQIHPSSVLFSRTQLSSVSSSTTTTKTGQTHDNRPAYIMFSEFVVTQRAYVRNVSVIQNRWLDEFLDSYLPS